MKLKHTFIFILVILASCRSTRHNNWTPVNTSGDLNFVWDMAVDGNGDLWLAAAPDLVRLSHDGKVFKHTFENDGPRSLCGGEVIGIITFEGKVMFLNPTDSPDATHTIFAGMNSTLLNDNPPRNNTSGRVVLLTTRYLTAYVSPRAKLPFVSPAPPSGLSRASLMVSLSIRSRCRAPEPVPVLTVTVRAIPLPLTLVIETPLILPVVTSAKSNLSTPLTDSEKVTIKVTLEALVGSAFPRVIETTAGAALSRV